MLVSNLFGCFCWKDTLPSTNMAMEKMDPDWRCISHWTWGYSYVSLLEAIPKKVVNSSCFFSEYVFPPFVPTLPKADLQAVIHWYLSNSGHGGSRPHKTLAFSLFTSGVDMLLLMLGISGAIKRDASRKNSGSKKPWGKGRFFKVSFKPIYCSPLFDLSRSTPAPENGWLEYDRFLLGPGQFSGAKC